MGYSTNDKGEGAEAVLQSFLDSLGMSSNVSSASSIASTSGRTADVPNLQRLKSPEEGGNKKDYEDFLDKIASFVTITWTGGSDVGSVLRSGELPDISPPH